MERSDIIWIQDAMSEYGRSRAWLDEQIKAQKLTVVTIAGDRRVYLVRAELDALLRPQPRQQGQQDAC